MTKEKKEVVMKQMELSIESFMGDMEKQIEQGFVGIITEVTPVTNSVYFKDDTGKFIERDGWAVMVELQDGTHQAFSSWFSKPSMRGLESSNMWAFKQKYGRWPTVNLQVKAKIDENGFFRIEF
jgi:hypothetical protein